MKKTTVREALINTQRKLIKQRFIIDESGSMISQKGQIISGFNEQLESMHSEEQEKNVRYLVSLTKFSYQATNIYMDLPLHKVPKLTKENYQPNGGTALLDAFGANLIQAESGERNVLITIMTDGYENSSTKWTKPQIKVLVELRQRENKWGFVYFGANQDAWSEAQSMGVHNSVGYDVSKTGQTISAMAQSRSCYTANVMSGNFSSLDSLADDIDESKLK